MIILSPLEVYGPNSVTGLRRTWVYTLMKAGQFPASYRHPGSRRGIGWLKSDIDAWLADREKQKTAKKAPPAAEG